MNLKKLPTTVSHFPTMINGNYLYVDKTERIYTLIERDRYYFLSRPRRFGKTLLVSTLKELFLGHRGLFKDLWINQSDYEWKEYPVVHLDFSRITHRTPELFEKSIATNLKRCAHDYGIELRDDDTLQDMLTIFIEELGKAKGPIVFLVDEYDYPLLRHVNDENLATSLREVLKDFYAALKSLNPYLHFIFITGVTKFSKTSLFSGMNNLNDISLKPEAAALLGYTHDEITTYFSPYIEAFARNRDCSVSSIMSEMREWYDGYRFSELGVRVYNPFSTLYYLKDQVLANYWFTSGTPTFLMHLLEDHIISLDTIEQSVISSRKGLSTSDIKHLPLEALLFQTGYLTITDHDPELEVYRLGFPNKEVREALTANIVAVLTHTEDKVDTALYQIKSSLKPHSLKSHSAAITKNT